MTAALYRLDDLGWLQFELLCDALLRAGGHDEPQWLGHADRGRVAVLGPSGATAVAVWIREDPSEPRRLAELARLVSDLPGELGFMFGSRVTLLCNLDAGAAGRVLRSVAPLRDTTIDVLGAGELSKAIDRHPEVRARLPSLLGVRDLSPLLTPETRARSSLDVEAAQALARVFWPTRAHERTRETLVRHRFVVLTGPPEMGKTAIARMIALAQMTVGWEAHECNAPEQLWAAYDPARSQVFVADDAFGSTEYRPDAADRWARALGQTLAALDERHWLVWTSRPAPLRSGLARVRRERGSERFPAPGEVLVDAADLDLAEKTLILFRHAKAQRATTLARRLVRSCALTVVQHPHFTPERIRRFVSERIETLTTVALEDGFEHVTRAVRRELALPTEAMRTSFRALSDEHRGLLIALLDAPAGLIEERELIAATRRHHPGGLSRPPAELIDRLTDHFLRVSPFGIDWVHPSWRDLVIEELGADATVRHRFLSACGVEGAMLALSHQGGIAGERALPLLVDDRDWDCLDERVDRLTGELEEQELARLLLALRDACTAGLLAVQLPEARALADQVLAGTAARWDRERRRLSGFVVEAWYGLNAATGHRAAPPSLAWTWADLHPGTPPDGALSQEDLVRIDEWLALVELLTDRDPRALRELGFLHADQTLLAGLIAALERTLDPGRPPLAEAILQRIERLPLDSIPRDAVYHALDRVAYERTERDWWVPEDLPAPPSDEPAAPGRADFTADDVARVLSDL